MTLRRNSDLFISTLKIAERISRFLVTCILYTLGLEEKYDPLITAVSITVELFRRMLYVLVHTNYKFFPYVIFNILITTYTNICLH